MEESIYWSRETADATPKTTPAPKTNETRIVEALESIASELLHIRQQLESVTDSGAGFGSQDAIRTTGR